MLIAHVAVNGNNTDDYYNAGIHIVLSDALVDVDLAACDQKCMKDQLSELVGDGKWRGWMVSAN